MRCRGDDGDLRTRANANGCGMSHGRGSASLNREDRDRRRCRGSGWQRPLRWPADECIEDDDCVRRKGEETDSCSRWQRDRTRRRSVSKGARMMMVGRERMWWTKSGGRGAVVGSGVLEAGSTSAGVKRAVAIVDGASGAGDWQHGGGIGMARNLEKLLQRQPPLSRALRLCCCCCSSSYCCYMRCLRCCQ